MAPTAIESVLEKLRARVTTDPGSLTQSEHEMLAADWAEHLATHGDRPTTLHELDAATDVLVEVLKRQKARADALEARVRALESALTAKSVGVEWKGTFDASATPYGVGCLTTCSGGLWLATRATAQRPGSDDSWKLIVKRGSFDDGTRAAR